MVKIFIHVVLPAIAATLLVFFCIFGADSMSPVNAGKQYTLEEKYRNTLAEKDGEATLHWQGTSAELLLIVQELRRLNKNIERLFEVPK